MPDVKPGGLMIGPLTAEEWVSFALPGDDERNPLPSGCGDVSEVRDAVFAALRMGGDPIICWRSIAAVWDIVEGHLVDGIEHPDVPAALRKLYNAYVAGRIRPDRSEGYAHLFERKAHEIQQFVDAAPDAWDLDTREGRMRALTRLGGAFVGFVLHPTERYAMVKKLAEVVGFEPQEVCFAVDVLRLHQDLPYEETWPPFRHDGGKAE